MTQTSRTPLSILDLSPIIQGGSVSQSFAHSRELAVLAEQLGYHRYWLAEHHNMEGIASSATAVLIGYIASVTKKMRVGAGGIMLPNHAPLTIAEQFGTLATLYPNRIDLGLGRAPGTNQETAKALRRDECNTSKHHQASLRELQSYFDDEDPARPIKAIPAQGVKVPFWLLGSSLYSAQLAGKLGLPFAYAAHFAPDMFMQSLEVYRQEFIPSASLQKPYAMVCLNVIAADNHLQAERLFSSLQLHFANMLRGKPGPLLPPVDDVSKELGKHELYSVNHTLSLSIVGDKADVRDGLQNLLQETGIDEIMINGQIFDHQARLRSFELIADIAPELTR